MHDVVDLRSDTLTLPTAEMREAMARADVGDDVWEEDPTVKRLEAMAARRLGKDAGLLVTSGTQGNLVSVVAQTRAGQEIVLDADSHVFNYEVGGAAVVAHAQTRPIKTARGFLTPEQVREAIRPANIHLAQTALVCIENTHNRHGGTYTTPEEIAAVAEVAHAAGASVHLDGARLFNAAVALRRPAADFCRHVDSVTFCLSKGLGAPVGSLVCGSADLVLRARRVRKMLGGGMRQAGIIAAAGIVALEHMVDRLADDHANARTLAEGLAKLPGLRVNLASVQTNIVIFHIDRRQGREGRPEGPPDGQPEESVRATQELVAGCAARKVKVHAIAPTSIRCVTHKDVDADDITRTLDALREITQGWA